ncbi:hypothetical protein ACFXG4_05015 [Nocardia sp. NPDC059246]|uniref:hypothetical protein n=1 Tax=unclassified Nocardia TaxID=2637762 RepID=UPI0036C58F39
MNPPEDTLIEIEGCNKRWITVAGPGQWEQGVALADEDSGTDFDGMYEAPFTAIYNATAFSIGADFGGYREDKYDFILAFHIIGTPEMPWREADSEFRKMWSVRRDSKIWVTVGGSRRSLTVRLGAKPKIKAINDPNSEGYALALLPLVGPYPRWVEKDFETKFITETDTTDGSVETGYVTAWNPLPEDYPSWPQWDVQGEAGIVWTIPDYSWGSDEHERAEEDALHKIVMPPLIAGEHLWIDTDKMARNGQVNSSLDTQVYLRMAGKKFMYPFPGGLKKTQIPVSVTGAPIGAGIRLRCPLEWPRPWGLE